MAELQNLKSSFPPISDPEIEILILGTLPGDQSHQLGEYFANPRNRFWKIISTISSKPIPETYSEKVILLLENKIGVWNVLLKAERKGSLDSAIKNEVPNDLLSFIANHPKLRVIGFDGLKPEAYYDKYFTRRSDLTYLSLPSCSPANARCSLQTLCEKWAELLSHRLG